MGNTKEFGWFDREHTSTVATGLKVWAPCPMLCRWFSQAPGRGDPTGPCLEGCSVLELGAGIGMLGVVMARSGASRVFITDGNPTVLRIARINALVNEAANAHIARLEFGAEAAAAFRGQHGGFDVIVGADIIYTREVVVPAFESVDTLLSETGAFYLGFIDRDDTFGRELDRVHKEFGFERTNACFLSEALGDRSPDERPKSDAKGMLAELKRVLDRMPKGGACLGEAEEKVQLFEYRRAKPDGSGYRQGPALVCLSELD